MLSVLGYKVTVGEVVVAVALAIAAERLWRWLRSFINWFGDLYARRSISAAQRKIQKLQRQIAVVESTLGNVERLVRLQALLVGRAAYSIGFSAIAVVFSLCMLQVRADLRPIIVVLPASAPNVVAAANKLSSAGEIHRVLSYGTTVFFLFYAALGLYEMSRSALAVLELGRLAAPERTVSRLAGRIARLQQRLS